MTRHISWLGWGLYAALAVSPAWAFEEGIDWNAWRQLPVQDGHRIKPFDSLARETVRRMTGRESIADPDTGETLEPVAAYLTLVFEWQGWDSPTRAGSGHVQRSAKLYFGRHTGDPWDHLPLLPIPGADLRDLLNLPRGSHAIAPYELSQAKIEVPESHEQRPFVTWAERLGQKDVDQRTTLERHAWELMQHYWDYQRHRMGDRLLVVPSRDGTRSRWQSLSDVVTGSFDENSDPSGKLRAVQQSFAAARQSHYGSSHEVQFASLDSLRQALSDLNELDGSSSQATALRWEVWSNQWRPFRWSWICLLLAATLFALRGWMLRRWCDRCGWMLYAGGCLAVCVGVVIRVAIAGRWLGANMYESVVLVGAAVVLLGLLGGFLERGRVCLFASASMGAIFLGMVDMGTHVIDPSLQPLPIALRNTPWFVIHGLATVLGVAFLALSAAISNVQLGLLLGCAASHARDRHLLPLIERTAHWGKLCLAAGIVTGGLWAERAWGRFWDWDPKEVWTLIALLAYLAAQHAQSAGWLKTFGTAACNSLCFQLVVVAWYGVNGLGRSGRHDFGNMAAPASWLYVVMILQIVVVTAAGVHVAWRAYQAREERRLGMQLPAA